MACRRPCRRSNRSPRLTGCLLGSCQYARSSTYQGGSCASWPGWSASGASSAGRCRYSSAIQYSSGSASQSARADPSMISSATSYSRAAHSCRSCRSRVGTFAVAKMTILSTCVPWVQMDLMSPSNFVPQPLPLDGTGEHDDVGGGECEEPDRERQFGGQVRTEGLEVASLISAGRHRPGGRNHVGGDAPLGHLAAQVLERMVLVVRGHAPKGEPDHLGGLAFGTHLRGPRCRSAATGTSSGRRRPGESRLPVAEPPEPAWHVFLGPNRSAHLVRERARSVLPRRSRLRR